MRQIFFNFDEREESISHKFPALKFAPYQQQFVYHFNLLVKFTTTFVFEIKYPYTSSKSGHNSTSNTYTRVV